MPYICWNSETKQVYTRLQLNKYNMEYYGVWYNEMDEENGIPKIEQTELIRSFGLQDADLWTLVEVDERTLKLFNVKLNNSPKVRLYYDGHNHSWSEPQP
ncbi:hypothetical protein [Paenibacillus sp. J2TS4]|uniref:hypothetical protein n=1 Tax=Paenibacillus sp. J2TS4 TaxID=2807194 RepID=UPI001B0E15E3|nr:hypothetical protein [Paenibacillus sp. J2TS4]GIP32175.1 hypothetical protein J2TS4_13850 [Paenibacillus sp. J2TS4]